MKLINTLTFLGGIFSLLLNCLYLQADDSAIESISIAAPLSAPFVYEDELGKPQGLLIELFALVEQQTGLKTTIAIMPWVRAMHEVKVNRVNALMPAVYTNERAKTFVYPELPLVESSTVFLKRSEDNIVIGDITQLGTEKTIVKVRGMSMGKTFDDAEKAGLINVIGVRDDEQAIQMLVASRVDLFASIDYISNFSLRKLNLHDKIDILKFSSEKKPAYLVFSQAFSKQHDVNVIMQKISKIKTTKEYQALVDKFLK